MNSNMHTSDQPICSASTTLKSNLLSSVSNSQVAKKTTDKTKSHAGVPPPVRESGWGGVIVSPVSAISTKEKIEDIENMPQNRDTTYVHTECRDMVTSMEDLGKKLNSDKTSRTVNIKNFDIQPIEYSFDSSFDIKSMLQKSSYKQLEDEISPILRAYDSWKRYIRSAEMNVNDPCSNEEEVCDPYNSSLEEIKLSVEGISDLSFLPEYIQSRFPSTSLGTLDLNVNDISNLDTFSKLDLPNLFSINLNDNCLRNINGLKNCPNLQYIYINSNKLTNISTLENFPKLVHVSASTNQITSIPCFHSNKLQKLELYHNNIEVISASSFRTMSSSLTHLDIGRNKLQSISGDALSQCKLLSQLILSQNQLSSPPSPLYLPNLKCLWLSRNSIKDLDSWIGSSVDKSNPWPVFLPMLEKLFLQDNNILSVSKYALITSPFLVELDLSFNQISSTDFLYGVTTCKCLQLLNLQDNPIYNNNSINSDSNCERSIIEWVLGFAPLAREISSKIVLASERCLRETVSNQSSCGDSSNKYAEQCLLHLISMLTAEQYLSKQINGNNSNNLESYNKNALITLQKRHIETLVNWDSSKGGVPSQYSVYLHHKNNSQNSDSQLNNSQANNKDSKKNPESLIQENPSVQRGVTMMQAIWRGYYLRKKLTNLLDVVQYKDDELDAMLVDFENIDDHYWSTNLPELEDNWLLKTEGDMAYQPATIVYGDHRRKKYAPSLNVADRQDSNYPEDIKYVPASMGSNAISGNASSQLHLLNSNMSVHVHTFSQVTDEGTTDALRGFNLPSRPNSQSSNISGASSRGMNSARSSAMSELSEEWGISNPQLLETIARRNRKMK